jgi:hypothetical protein
LFQGRLRQCCSKLFFKKPRNLMIKSAVSFQADLENLVIELQAARLLKLNGEFTAAQIAQALADGGRAVNQALPPIARDGFSARYRQMCAMVLYGCAVMPKRSLWMATLRRHRGHLGLLFRDPRMHSLQPVGGGGEQQPALLHASGAQSAGKRTGHATGQGQEGR